MAGIELLPPCARSKIRSGVAVTSPSHCVEELVHNAIDAGAKEIEVSVDLPCHKFQVSDDGAGISQSDLCKIAKRYMTSKCRRLSDLDGGIRTLGYRGEALASIRDFSGFLQIISRQSSDCQAVVALFYKGERKPTRICQKEFRPRGTVVNVMDFLYNVPVRKNLVSPSVDLDCIHYSLIGLCLTNPSVRLTLRNEADCRRTLISSTGTTSNSLEVFAHLFGSLWTQSSLAPLCDSSGSLRLEGFVAREGVMSSQSNQFVSVNGRSLSRGSQLHKLVRECLSRSVMCRPLPANRENKADSPTKSGSKMLQAVFSLELLCPLKECHVCLEPRKTLVEFEDWDKVSQFVRSSLEKFLRENFLYPPFVLLGDSNSPSSPSKLPPPISPSVSGIFPLEVRNFTQSSGESEDEGEDDLGCKLISFGDQEKESSLHEDESIHQPILKGAKESLTSGIRREHVDRLDTVDGVRRSKAVTRNSKLNFQGLKSRKRVWADNRVYAPEKEQQSSLPEGWITKKGAGDKTWYVHLASGMTSEKWPIISQPTTAHECSSRHNHQYSRILLPAGDTSFLPKKSSRWSLKGTAAAGSEKSNDDSGMSSASSESVLSDKWRSSDAKSADLSLIHHDSSVMHLISEWQNPNFTYCSKIGEMPRANVAETFNFERKMFKDIRIIGQVDKKFIAAIVKAREEVLVFFDQHAVHERIRLEALTEENFPGQFEVISVSMKPSMSLSLGPSEVRLLCSFGEKVKKFGLALAPSKEAEGDVYVSTVPKAYLLREVSELKNNRPSPMKELVKATLADIADTLKETKGAIAVMPRTLTNVLNSQACKSAIKFGDTLSSSACKRLLDQLSRCQAPFQCAHGRPSVVPITSITKVMSNIATSSKHPLFNMAHLQSLLAAAESNQGNLQYS